MYLLSMIPNSLKRALLVLIALAALYSWFGYWLNKQKTLAVESDRITISNEVTKKAEEDAENIAEIFEADGPDAISRHIDELFIESEQSGVQTGLPGTFRDKAIPAIKRQAERDESNQSDSGLGAQNGVQPTGFTDTETRFIIENLQ